MPTNLDGVKMADNGIAKRPGMFGETIWYRASKGSKYFHRLAGPAIIFPRGDEEWFVEQMHLTYGEVHSWMNTNGLTKLDYGTKKFEDLFRVRWAPRIETMGYVRLKVIPSKKRVSPAGRKSEDRIRTEWPYVSMMDNFFRDPTEQHALVGDLFDWCEQNIVGYFVSNDGICFYFSETEDALAFKLRWIG